MNQATSRVSSPSREEVSSIVADAIAQESEASFSAAGAGSALDSLVGVAVTLRLEEQLGISIPDGELTPANMRSVEAIVDLVMKRLS